MAAREGHREIVIYLVDNRAHINTGDNDRVSVRVYETLDSILLIFESKAL